MLRLYIIGLFILIVAIIANAIVIKIGLKSWYDLFNLLNESGTNAFKQLSFLDYMWLFIGYPLVLSFGYVAGNAVYKILSN